MNTSPVSLPSSPLHDARLALLLADVESRPDSVESLLALARACNARCMEEEARRATDSLLRLAPDSGDAWWEAIVARSFGRPEELDALQPRAARLAAAHPAAAWPQRNLALLAYYRDRDDDTRRAASRALEIDPSDSRTHEVLGYLAYTVGDLDGAVESSIRAVEMDPRNHRALHWLGECYLKLDAPEQAERYLLRCLGLEEHYFFALESLGSLYFADDTTLAAGVQCFARLLSVNPRHFPAWFRLADAFIQADRLTEAAAQASIVLHLNPDPTAEADAHQYLGLIRLMERRLAEAREHLERALAIDARFAAAHHYLGVVEEQSGHLDAAEARYREAVECDAEYALPHARLGYLCFDRKELANAKRHFEAALAIDDGEYLAHLGLAEIARWRKDFREQLVRCERAQALAPDDTNVANQLGTAHDALGDLDRAIACYERALELDPRNRQAANNLGFVLERRLKDARPGEHAGLRTRAIEAWKRRLLICRDAKASLRGARAHLDKLGVRSEQVEDWLSTAILP